MLTVILFTSINHRQIKLAIQIGNHDFGSARMQLNPFTQPGFGNILLENVGQFPIGFNCVQYAISRQTFGDTDRSPPIRATVMWELALSAVAILLGCDCRTSAARRLRPEGASRASSNGFGEPPFSTLGSQRATLSLAVHRPPVRLRHFDVDGRGSAGAAAVCGGVNNRGR